MKRARKKNPAELVVLTANPTETLRQASDMYEDFHGEPGQHVDEIHEPAPRPVTLTELGELLELRVRRANGWKWGSLDFTGRGVRLASNPEGTQLYFVDGDQRIGKGDMTALGADRTKTLVDLGEAMLIAYRARKVQVMSHAANYEHFFGEETGVRPRLGLDRRGREPRLFLSGGQYHVEAAGIVN